MKQLALRNVSVVFVVLFASASLGVSLAFAQAGSKPKPTTAVKYNCLKLVPPSRLAALTGGTFALAFSRSIASADATFCGYNGWAQPPLDGALTGSAQSPDTAMGIFSGTTAAGKALVAKEWKTYSHPPADGKYCGAPAAGATVLDPRDCHATPLAGLGDKAVEFNDYIVVQKGSTLFQLWAGNNGGHHLSYDQLETVARYLLTKIK